MGALPWVLLGAGLMLGGPWRAGGPTQVLVGRDVTELPLVLDLVAIALRAGSPMAEALGLAAPAAPDLAPQLDRVAGLLRLGSEPGSAWAMVADGVLAPVARAATRSAASGARTAAVFERVAAQVRVEQHTRDLGRAHRAGVQVLGPLGACFLPAFLCLGIVPAVVGIAATAVRPLA